MEAAYRVRGTRYQGATAKTERDAPITYEGIAIMATLDELLQSIISNADSIRDSLTPHVLAMHQEEMWTAAKLADNAVEEISLILESPDPRKATS